MKTIYPILSYDDAPAAIDFLERAFGCERREVHEGQNGGAHESGARWRSSHARCSSHRWRDSTIRISGSPRS